MKYVIIFCILISGGVLGQTKGNRQIETRHFTAANLQQLEIGLYAQIVVDGTQQKEGESMISITTDSNLFDLIDTEVVGQRLTLHQLDWIQPSTPIQITIKAPLLRRLQLQVHQTVLLKNVKATNLSLMAILGKIQVQGEVGTLNVACEKGTVDAAKLKAQKAYLNIWDSGKAILNVSTLLESSLSDRARLELIRTPQQIRGDIQQAVTNNRDVADQKAEYISVKIKNNSWNRNQFAVQGPKPDGSYFGYGFTMMPGTVKKEKWTVGTKVYKVNALGIRKLLLTLTAEDANQTVNLFD